MRKSKLIFIHGIGGSASSWERQVELLGDDFYCLSPDLPGYGDAPAPTGDGLDPFVETIVELLNNEPSSLVGVSFGALVAIAVAHRHPSLISSLVLADATLGRAHMESHALSKWLSQRRILAAKLQQVSVQRAEEIATPDASANVIEEIARHMRRARPEGYLAVASAVANTDARAWLPTINAPTLVICGENDQVTGTAVSQALAAALPNASLQPIERAGHAPHIEQPEIFANHVRRFLQGRHPDSSSGDQPTA